MGGARRGRRRWPFRRARPPVCCRVLVFLFVCVFLWGGGGGGWRKMGGALGVARLRVLVLCGCRCWVTECVGVSISPPQQREDVVKEGAIISSKTGRRPHKVEGGGVTPLPPSAPTRFNPHPHSPLLSPPPQHTQTHTSPPSTPSLPLFHTHTHTHSQQPPHQHTHTHTHTHTSINPSPAASAAACSRRCFCRFNSASACAALRRWCFVRPCLVDIIYY
jgi:hypothetical protein